MDKSPSKTTHRKLLHMTVGAYPSGQINLEREFALIKAALLYADQIKVFSPTAIAIKMIERVESLPPEFQVKFLERTIPIISEKGKSENLILVLNTYKHLIEKKHLNRDELIAKSHIENLLKQPWELLSDSIRKITKESQIKELDKLEKLGLLEFHIFKDTNTLDAEVNFMAECIEVAATGKRDRLNNDSLVKEFIEQIGNAIQDNSTYPLFDSQVDSLVRASIRANVFHPSESGIERGKHVGLAKSLFDQLPLFEYATLDEILDIRNDLETPLIRFRKAIINYSENIKSASWDMDFTYEAEKIFHRDVKHALLEIEESTRSNKYLASLARKFIEKPLAIVPSSLISIAMASFTSLPPEIALSLGVGIPSLAIIYDAYEEWLKKKQITEQNLLYFYYQTNKKLG